MNDTRPPIPVLWALIFQKKFVVVTITIHNVMLAITKYNVGTWDILE